MCANKWVSVLISISRASSGAVPLLFVCLFVLSYSNMLILLFYSVILSFYYHLEACLFTNKIQKSCGSEWEGK